MLMNDRLITVSGRDAADGIDTVRLHVYYYYLVVKPPHCRTRGILRSVFYRPPDWKTRRLEADRRQVFKASCRFGKEEGR